MLLNKSSIYNASYTLAQKNDMICLSKNDVSSLHNVVTALSEWHALMQKVKHVAKEISIKSFVHND